VAYPSVGSLIFVSLSFMTGLTMINTRYVSVVLVSQCIIKVTLQRRSIEDLKEHYYSVCNRLSKVNVLELKSTLAFSSG